MPGIRTRLAHGLSRGLLLPIIVLVSIVSIVPLLETNTWWVRYLDFPRIQFIIVLLAALAVYVAIGHWRRKVGMVAIALAVVALGYNVYRLYPYIPIPSTHTSARCPSDARLRVMIANVQETNRRSAKLLEIVRRIDPDIFLAMETGAWWNRQLAALDDRYAHQIQKNPKNARYFGIHLFSHYPLIDPKVRFFFGAQTPTIITGVQLPNRAQPIQFIGLHPRPPQSFSQPSTLRDGAILKAATIAGQSSRPTIVAGDFNAVSWERVTRRAIRLGGFLDPRVNRGFIPSYDAESLILAWPLDQILYQNAFTVIDFKRLPRFGSDHYPVMADLCTQPASDAIRQPPQPRPDDRAEAQQAIEAARNYLQ